MALRDDQVVRYSRQILLRQVGGAGQQALLGAVVVPHGEGPALELALAYLSACGIAVAGVGPVGPFGVLNPDGRDLAGRTVTVQIGSAPAACAPGPAVWMGAAGARTRLLVLPAGGCGACAAQSWVGLGPVPPGPRALLAGAHAALAVQRCVLGWQGEVPVLLEVAESGETRHVPRAGCPEHPR
jgi:hypothetical protein